MDPALEQTKSSKSFFLITSALVLLLAVLACMTDVEISQPLFETATDNETVPIVEPDSPVDWFTVYFSDPDNLASNSLRGGPDKALADAIKTARISVDIAAYDFNLWSLRDALIEAYRRGLVVRMVTESDNLDREELQELIAAGVMVLGDRREGLMHHKFVVIDRQEVWTGSMNFTLNGAYRNNNNLIRIRSIQLAENYTAEFEEMYMDDLFGESSPANTVHPYFELDGTLIETYFSPDDGTAARIIQLISEAKESIYFLAFSFTSDDIATALIERAQAGVAVSGVFEESQYRSNIGAEYDNLRAAGLDVHLDGNREDMHHKVIIVDEAIVITGSYNFSASAEKRNDENTLILHQPDLVAAYVSEFKDILLQAKP
jgi:phosphatidylserine/phosphatidylglycerophosphate/cardiolipin synthase-like enzyme